MRKKPRFVYSAFLFLAVPFFNGAAPALCAQEQNDLDVRILAASGDLSENERSSLVSLVEGYAQERAQNAPLSTPEESPKAGLGEQYSILGTINESTDISRFTLEVTRASDGKKFALSTEFNNLNDLALQLRSLVGETMDALIENQGSTATRGDLSLETLAGYWQGDKGLEVVKISRDGHGVASLSTGASLRVTVAIKGNQIEISQEGPNLADYYLSRHYERSVAEKIAAQARPMHWVFTLSADGRTLVGFKDSVSVSGDVNGELTIDNTYRRPATWKKIR
jgi:hypothetical protein